MRKLVILWVTGLLAAMFWAGAYSAGPQTLRAGSQTRPIGQSAWPLPAPDPLTSAAEAEEAASNNAFHLMAVEAALPVGRPAFPAAAPLRPRTR